ncbi:class I SAM-dependent methyltransferase [Paenibacillus glufosinatiresistens]|uniref:class I SAM-dependent methyltransferase n=1 Tax=Paenibacillus glufosinatiresistens TaxID=3070657 RepID=UPI00286DA5AF|nr:class I SAM-dependent methyltransferase [Paenibacillus sp. YX.27]
MNENVNGPQAGGRPEKEGLFAAEEGRQSPEPGAGASGHSEEVWNEDTYSAWVRRFGTPEEAAEKLRGNPAIRLRPLDRHFGDVRGKRIMNLMGSNGMKAVALALLGAEASVADFSEGNAAYAERLAEAADVPLRYYVSDVLKLPPEAAERAYDIVFAEQGIVHYFTDLRPFMETAFKLLLPGGTFILRDFHPVSTKLIHSRGSTAKVRKHKVDGDYFDESLEAKMVSYSKYLPGGALGQAEERTVYWRRWTLGEIVTAAAEAGFRIQRLEEEPNLSSDTFDKGIPKTFTLVAHKP